MEPKDVVDKESFIAFVTQLSNEDARKWSSRTTSDFIETIAHYTEDVQGYYDNTNQPIDSNKASWRVFADILKGATIYE